MFNKDQTSKQDPLATYKLPFKTKGKPKTETTMKTEVKVEKPRPIYSLELIFSLKPQNKARPANMSELDFPSKKRGSNLKGGGGFHRKAPLSEKDKFNK